MLFRQVQHPGIAAGEITHSYRVWKTPKVKVGGRYNVWTIGFIEVDLVEQIPFAEVREEHARMAGFADRPALAAELARASRQQVTGALVVTRVAFHFVGEIERAQPELVTDLTDADLAEITTKLDKMDARSGRPWTRPLLRLIAERPGTGSVVLARELDRERTKLKADVRKLKRLGLTQSLDVGYRLSPRGTTWLASSTDQSS